MLERHQGTNMTTLCLSDAFGFDELPPEAVLGRPQKPAEKRAPANEDELEKSWLRRLAREPARNG